MQAAMTTKESVVGNKGIIGLFLFSMCIIPMIGLASEEVERGKLLSVSCAPCHGADGNTAVSQWPKLAGQHKRYLFSQMLAFKDKEKKARENPVMEPIVQSMSEEDMAAVSAYYASLSNIHGDVPSEYVELGRQIYRGGLQAKNLAACTACHGPAGKGIPSAKFPLLSGQNVEYLIQQIKAYRDGTRKTDPNKIMRDIANKMSDEEITAVAYYVHGLH